jgi:hypothetical protein
MLSTHTQPIHRLQAHKVGKVQHLPTPHFKQQQPADPSQTPGHDRTVTAAQYLPRIRKSCASRGGPSAARSTSGITPRAMFRSSVINSARLLDTCTYAKSSKKHRQQVHQSSVTNPLRLLHTQTHLQPICDGIASAMQGARARPIQSKSLQQETSKRAHYLAPTACC